MSQAVQASCPYCKVALRIPADWLARPMRCKHCHQTFVTKGSPLAAQTVAAPSVAPVTARGNRPFITGPLLSSFSLTGTT